MEIKTNGIVSSLGEQWYGQPKPELTIEVGSFGADALAKARLAKEWETPGEVDDQNRPHRVFFPASARDEAVFDFLRSSRREYTYQHAWALYNDGKIGELETYLVDLSSRLKDRREQYKVWNEALRDKWMPPDKEPTESNWMIRGFGG